MKNLFFLIFLSLFAVSVSAADLKPVDGEVSAPELKLTNLSGEPVDLADLKGKVVLVQFWATYCPPCRKEMPSMNRLVEKMGDTPFVILAVNMGETKGEVDAFVQEVGPEFPILLDSAGDSIGAWKVFAAPSNFVIDPEGKIRYTLFGGVEWDEEQIVSTLKELAAS